MFYHIHDPILDIPVRQVMYEMKKMFDETFAFFLRNACCLRFFDTLKELFLVTFFLFDVLFRGGAIFVASHQIRTVWKEK